MAIHLISPSSDFRTPVDFSDAIKSPSSDLRTPVDYGVFLVNLEVSFQSQCPEPEPIEPPDEIAPVVDAFDPAPGTQIEVDTPLRFSVTDNLGSFTRTIVTAKFPDGSEEIIHDWDSFNDYYAAHSARIAITNGFRYTVRRTLGWPGSPTIRVFAIDSSGNEAV